MNWTLKRDSASLGGKSGDPKLLLDKTGWRWPAADGEEVMVRFDAPMAKLSIEGRPSNEVRTHFVGDRIRPGRARIGLTVSLPEGGLIVATNDERYARPDASWFRQSLRWDMAPLDLSFLNADDRPAGTPRVRQGRRRPAGLRGRHARPVLGRQPLGPGPLPDAPREHPPPGAADGPARLQPDEDRAARVELGQAQHLRRRRQGHPAPRPPLAGPARLLDQVPEGRGHLRLAGHALPAGAQAGRRRVAGAGRDRQLEEQLLRVQLHQSRAPWT